MLERLAQVRTASVDTAADGTELHAERRGDLLVGQALDVAQHHGRAELGGQGVQRLLDVRVEVRVVEDLLGGRLTARQPLGGVVGERVEADPLLAADHVQEQVRGDAVQPALERAGRVRGQRAEDADEDLLREVLGVVLVARQTVGKAVDPRAVRADDLLPRGRGPRLRSRICGKGRGGCGVCGVEAVSNVGHGFRLTRRPEEASEHASTIHRRSRTSPVGSGGVQWSPYHSHPLCQLRIRVFAVSLRKP